MFGAGFIGSPQMNFVTCDVKEEDGTISLEFGTNKIKLPDGVATKVREANCVNREVILGIRPEDMHDEETFLASSPDSIIDAHVEVTEMLGAETYLYMKVHENNFTARVNPRSAVKAGDDIKIGIDINKIHLFDKETEVALLN